MHTMIPHVITSYKFIILIRATPIINNIIIIMTITIIAYSVPDTELLFNLIYLISTSTL